MTFQVPRFTATLFVTAHVACATTFGQTPVLNEDFKLLANDGAMWDYFGGSVSIDGDIAIIGANKLNTPGYAYIYRFDGTGWVEETTLFASDGVNYDRFGYSVSISGNTAIVGAHLDDDNGDASGSAYIYRFNGRTWIEEVKLLASDGASQDYFGRSVSISGNTVIVGAHNEDGNGLFSGSAYIYRFDGKVWIEESKLLASDGATGDFFGYSVSISGDRAIVGAVQDADNGTYSGSAYIYRFDGITWNEETKLLASDGVASDTFGYSVSISDNTAIVGILGDDDNGIDSGSAYIYRFDGTVWFEETKLLAGDGVSADWFSKSICISGDTVIIGAYGNDDNGSNSGSAYIYRFDGSKWVGETKLLASDGMSGDYFGWSVGISDDTVIVGAFFDDDNGSQSGSAYIFDLHQLACPDISDDGNVGVDDLLAIIDQWGQSNGSADINFDGIVDILDLLIVIDQWGPCQ